MHCLTDGISRAIHRLQFGQWDKQKVCKLVQGERWDGMRIGRKECIFHSVLLLLLLLPPHRCYYPFDFHAPWVQFSTGWPELVSQGEGGGGRDKHYPYPPHPTYLQSTCRIWHLCAYVPCESCWHMHWFINHLHTRPLARLPRFLLPLLVSTMHVRVDIRFVGPCDEGKKRTGKKNKSR